MSESGVGTRLSVARYLAERVDDQLRWYGDESASAKRWYHRLQLLTLVLAASVPVLSLSSGDMRVRVLVAVVGALASVSAGILALYRFEDRWVDYRSTAEAIKHEKYRFLTAAAPYAGAGAFSLFVNRVESIILRENRAWQEKTLEDGDETGEDSGRIEGKGRVGDEGRDGRDGAAVRTGGGEHAGEENRRS